MNATSFRNLHNSTNRRITGELASRVAHYATTHKLAFSALTCLTRSKQDETKAILQNKLIFDRYKIYLDQKVATLTTDLTSQTNHQSKHLERQSQGRQLKFKATKTSSFSTPSYKNTSKSVQGLLKQADISGALEKLETAQRSTHNHQKKIKLADNSEAGGSLLHNTRPRISQVTLKMRNALKKPKPQPM